LSMHLLEGRVIASVVHKFLVFQVQDIRGDVVEKVGIVRNYYDCMRVVLRQVVIEPQHCIQIQMVRRLIEHQQFRLQEKGLRQTDAHSPSA